MQIDSVIVEHNKLIYVISILDDWLLVYWLLVIGRSKVIDKN